MDKEETEKHNLKKNGLRASHPKATSSTIFGSPAVMALWL